MSDTPAKQRALVTGGAGFIGSSLVRHLLAAGHEVLTVDLLTYAGNPASLAGPDADPRHHFVRADVADESAMRSLVADFRPQRVFHLAAESHVDRSIDGPMDFVRTNVHGTASLLQAIRACRDGSGPPPLLLHVSTDEVYGSLGPTGRFTEASPHAPRSPYAATKAAAEHLVRAWSATYGLPAIVTHCGNNFGPRQFPEKLIPLAILKVLHGEPVPVFGRGDQVRDWIHVDDHCAALLLLAERGVPGETCHIGARQEWRNLDLLALLLELLHEATGRRGSLVHVADRPGHDFRYALEAAKLRALGWLPGRPFREALRETVRWYLENEAWWRPILENRYRLERLGAPES